MGSAAPLLGCGLGRTASLEPCPPDLSLQPDVFVSTVLHLHSQRDHSRFSALLNHWRNRVLKGVPHSAL